MTLSSQVRAVVEVGGSELSADVERRLIGVLVDTHIHLPDMFELTFEDETGCVVGDASMNIGTEVKIWAGSPDSAEAPLLIAAEVTAIMGEYQDLSYKTIVRGFEKVHRLHRGRKTKTFNNMKDSDIARQVASGAGLTVGTIDSSRVTHEHVSQVNMTDWEFLKARAAEIGYEVRVTDGQFHFKEPTAASEGPGAGDLESTDLEQLVFKRNLLWFKPRLNSGELVPQVEVRAWDPMKKEVIKGTADVDTTQSDVHYGPADLATAFGGGGLPSVPGVGGGGGPKSVIVDRPVATKSEADAIAEATAKAIGSGIISGEGMAIGNPKVQAGAAIGIGMVPGEFEGNYTVTNARHIIDERGYRTHFVISGAADHSLLGLTGGSGTNGSASGSPINGFVIGIVDDNDDPEALGRVKLQFPWLADDYVSDWARIVQLGAGPDSGVLFIPEVNDEVLVGFEFGDVRRPYVVGSLFNGKDKPKLGSGLFDMGKVKRRGVVSRTGHKLIFFDDSSKSGIALVSADGKMRVSLNETNSEIHVNAQNGAKVTVETGSGGDVMVKCGANVTVEAQQNLTLKGTAGVKIESSGIVEVKGSMIKLN